jgi:hypothetical protein
MSRPTDRQLLDDIHFRVCNPVLFPGLEPTPEAAGILIPGFRYMANINITGSISYCLVLQTEVVDRISFRYWWELDGRCSRNFFAQLGPTPPDA